jgi:hypothetical protein
MPDMIFLPIIFKRYISLSLNICLKSSAFYCHDLSLSKVNTVLFVVPIISVFQVFVRFLEYPVSFSVLVLVYS